jgi:type I restriction enzyme M protein
MPEADPDLRDTENVPLKESISGYFEREVLPHVPDAWINESVTDQKDGLVGKVGYEINFNRYFYTYTPPRPLEEIEAEIKGLEAEILVMVKGMMG